MKSLTRFLLLSALFAAPLARAHDAEGAVEMSHAAQALLAALTPEQKGKAQFSVPDDERKNWHFIPRARKGLPIKEMRQAQRLLAYALLSSGLSSQGYEKAASIMSLEDVLANLEHGSGPARDPEMYFVSIFGEPGEAAPWGWRVEGHHLSLNFGCGKQAPADSASEVRYVTPSFFGTNPGEVREGPRAGFRPLSDEEDLARKLVQSLDEAQRKEAVIMAEAPKDVLNVPGRNERTAPQGVAAKGMKPEQRAMLSSIIREYLGNHRPAVAAAEMERIEKAGLDTVQFAWAGGMQRGEGHYYRVQGPTFVLEYDNTQNNANHVHALWRDFTNDFGGDALAQHYEQSHAAK